MTAAADRHIKIQKAISPRKGITVIIPSAAPKNMLKKAACFKIVLFINTPCVANCNCD